MYWCSTVFMVCHGINMCCIWRVIVWKESMQILIIISTASLLACLSWGGALLTHHGGTAALSDFKLTLKLILNVSLHFLVIRPCAFSVRSCAWRDRLIECRYPKWTTWRWTMWVWQMGEGGWWAELTVNYLRGRWNGQRPSDWLTARPIVCL